MTTIKRSVLLIDQDFALRKIIEFKLEKAGYRFYYRSNGREGYKAILELKPDAVIMDIYQESMNGLEILKKIKEDEDLRHIKMLILSTTKRIEDFKLIDEFGADEFVEKPFIPDGLIIRLNRLFAD